MPAVSSIALGISAAAAAASAGVAAHQAANPPKAPKVKPPPPPPEPELPVLPEEEQELTPEQISQRRQEVRGATGLMAPSYLGLQQEMTPLQKRTKIATGAASGDVGTDPEAFKYYRNLAFSSIDDEGGIQPIERQYLGMFGESTRSQGVGGYLSAIERIYKRFG